MKFSGKRTSKPTRLASTPARSHGLPIEQVVDDVLDALRSTGRVVLEAPPGAGKTTGLPVHLLSEGFADDGEIWILQPRRLPARLAATRVAQVVGSPLGKRVGYTVRFEDKTSRDTQLRFVTEGILLRRLLSDPILKGVSMVLFDEFHERNMDADLGLAVLRHLQRTQRPDLRLG